MEVLEDDPEMSVAPPPPEISLGGNDSTLIPPEPLQPDDYAGMATSTAPEDYGEMARVDNVSSKSVNLSISTACDSWELPANLNDVAPRYSLRSANKLKVQHKLL